MLSTAICVVSLCILWIVGAKKTCNWTKWLWVSMQPTCQGILCAPNASGQFCPLHHCSHRSLTRSQSSSTLRTSSTCSLISSPILRPFLSREDHFSKDWRTCTPPSSPLPLNTSNGLSVLTRPNSLPLSKASSNFPKNFKCVFNSFLLLFSECTSDAKFSAQWMYFSETNLLTCFSFLL